MRGPSTPLPRTKHRSGHSHEAPRSPAPGAGAANTGESERHSRPVRGQSPLAGRWEVGDREGCPCRAVSSVCLADPFLPVPPAIISPVPFLSHQHSVPNPSPPRTPRLGSVPGPPGTDPHRRPPHVHGGCRAGGRGCAGLCRVHTAQGQTDSMPVVQNHVCRSTVRREQAGAHAAGGRGEHWLPRQLRGRGSQAPHARGGGASVSRGLCRAVRGVSRGPR